MFRRTLGVGGIWLAGISPTNEFSRNRQLFGVGPSDSGGFRLPLHQSCVYPISYLSQLNYEETETRFQLQEQQPFAGVSQYGIAEDFPLDRARSLYGTTKLASELLIAEYAEAYHLRTLVNRCGVLTGPWQMGKVDQGVFALWVARHYFQKPLNYIGYGGTGKQVRDFLHVEDLLDLLDLQLQQLDQLQGETFNVGGGFENQVSLLETTQICQEMTGRAIEITPVPETRPGDIPIFITDSRKVMSQVDWTPKRGIEHTLQDIYDWIVREEDQVKGIFL